MERMNKKAIGGIVLAAILVAATFALPSASADLTALDKIGTIINIISDIQGTVDNIEIIVLDIQNTVNNIFSEVTDPEHGLAEIKREVRNIEGNVTSPDFGLEEIKNEVRDIEGNVTSPDFGLEEIKNEVLELRFLEADAQTPTAFFFIECDKNFVVTSARVTTSHDDTDDDFAIGILELTNGGIELRLQDPDGDLNPGSDIDIIRELMSFIGTPVGVKGGSYFEIQVSQTASDGNADSTDMDAMVLTQHDATCLIKNGAP